MIFYCIQAEILKNNEKTEYKERKILLIRSTFWSIMYETINTLKYCRIRLESMISKLLITEEVKLVQFY